ncbi:hypothetical protein QWZ08_25565 [Ferruginibacter paludis]|uniref:hypothetical protein n=1 Tax=Ferruginibacter paludis TaxID=1310417 RepID=UPI0025B4B220|nr:hypothetical protein [Ferruginibacter paludis]MDN3659038.1 hypothetical protein [Ferruginibacter paludis]
MKFKFLMFFLPVILIFACADSHRQRNVSLNKTDNKAAKHKPPSSYADTVKINPMASVVFYSPDTAQLEKIKAVNDKMIFESTMHEFFYQIRNSKIVVKKYYPNVKIMEVKNARYLLFKKADGKQVLIDLDTKDDPCGMFIFDGFKNPELADMTNVDTEIEFYFRK